MDEMPTVSDPVPEPVKQKVAASGQGNQNTRIIVRIVIAITLVMLLFLLPRILDPLYEYLPLNPPFGIRQTGALDWLPKLEPSPTFTPINGYEPLFTPTPSNTEVPTPLPLEAESSSYNDAQDLFQFKYPKGWRVENGEQEARLFAPEGKSMILVRVTHTGMPLDSQSFERFVEGRESNFFTQTDPDKIIYIPREKDVNDPAGNAAVDKELYQDGSIQSVRSLYRQEGEVIYSADLWAEKERFENETRNLDLIWESLIGDLEKMRTQEIYRWFFTQKNTESGYSVEIPISWKPERTKSRDSYIETFRSPDTHAIIQLIDYTSEIDLSDVIVGNFVLQLLRDYYTHDVIITEDRIASNGNEQLSWYSPSGGHRGKTQFRRIGLNHLVILTAVVDRDFLIIYRKLMDRTMDGFVVGAGVE